ncbi:hypothetical protein BUALT_Bualt19G0012300 [Buddleja alternifolia]|uniref:Thioesterase domain-containing protein n=1 Tax=Buddleja alternifolia TaxID=168488 RepID=A0AAV6VZK8_9LAMI|nr:hypothetical protein BUALT_Bualt19G0012300 [Buddleja alternifolia]
MATTTKATPTIASDELVTLFFNRMGAFDTLKPQHNVKDSFSNLVGGVLKVVSVDRGKISCILHVKAPILNVYGGMHGGAVAAVAERVAIGCARTVVGKDKDIFLGELSISYLSAAPHNAEVVVDGSVVRSGRNLTVVAVNFRLKDSGKLAFMTRSTFYNMPVSSL